MCFVQNKPKAEVLFVLSDLINSKAESQASTMKKRDLEQVVLNVSFTKNTGEGTLLFSFARVKDSTVSAPHRGQRHRYQCSQHVDEIKVKLKHSSIEFGIRKSTDEKKKLL